MNTTSGAIRKVKSLVLKVMFQISDFCKLVVSIEWRACNEKETQKVATLLQNGCGCSLGPARGNCSIHFSEEQLLAHREKYLELSSSELDIAVLTELQARTRQTATRKRQIALFTFQELIFYHC